MSQMPQTSQQNNVESAEIRLERTARTRKSIIRLETKRFRSHSGLRMWCWATLLRLALFAGYPVVLVGACRTGKSLLLHKLTPGNVIDHREHAMRGGGQVPLAESDVPSGIYAIDECQLIEAQSLKKLMHEMAAHRRTFCLSIQRYGVIEEAIDAYRSDENAQRVLLVVVGGQSNPMTILQELPQ